MGQKRKRGGARRGDRLAPLSYRVSEERERKEKTQREWWRCDQTWPICCGPAIVVLAWRPVLSPHSPTPTQSCFSRASEFRHTPHLTRPAVGFTDNGSSEIKRKYVSNNTMATVTAIPYRTHLHTLTHSYKRNHILHAPKRKQRKVHVCDSDFRKGKKAERDFVH